MLIPSYYCRINGKESLPPNSAPDRDAIEFVVCTNGATLCYPDHLFYDAPFLDPELHDRDTLAGALYEHTLLCQRGNLFIGKATIKGFDFRAVPVDHWVYEVIVPIRPGSAEERQALQLISMFRDGIQWHGILERLSGTRRQWQITTHVESVVLDANRELLPRVLSWLQDEPGLSAAIAAYRSRTKDADTCLK